MGARAWNREEDYPMLLSWWNDRGLQFWPNDLLPSDGFIGYNEDGPVCCCWLFAHHEVRAGWIAFITCKPDTDNEARTEAFGDMVSLAEERARELGVKLLYTPTNNASLATRFEQNGYVRCDTDVVDLLKIL